MVIHSLLLSVAKGVGSLILGGVIVWQVDRAFRLNEGPGDRARLDGRCEGDRRRRLLLG